MPDSTDATLTPYDPLNPTATPPSTMRNIMARYHADIGQQVDYTLADLQARWAPVRAALDQEIARLTQQMEAATAAGDTLSAAWLNEAQRLTQLKGFVEGNVAAFAAAARSGIGAAQLQAIQSGTAAAQAALAGVVPPGVNYTFGVPPDAVLHQLAGAVQPYSPLSNLFDEFGPQAAQQAAQALFTSVALGENPRAAAERLQWATDMPARRAEVIARTEIARSWRGAQLANYRANSDVVQGWEWLCDHGPRSCSACLALDGTIHPLTEELDGHVMCRCSAAPLTGSWSDILRDAGVAEEDIPQSLREVDEVEMAGAGVRQTGEEWLRDQSVEVQNLIMGPAKAEAWRQGAFQLRDLVGVRHDPVWGSSIQELSLKQMGLDAQSWLTAAREGGSGSMLADEEALRAANAQTFARHAEAQQIAEQLARTPYRGPTAAYVERVEAALAPHVEQYAALHPEMTLDEYKAAVAERLQQLMENASPSIRRTSDAFDKILHDGRFKSAHEVGATEIAPGERFGEYIQGRAAYEEAAFGYSAEAATHEAPIYGYFTREGADNVMARQYGEVRIVLTEDAKARATVTFADSLESDGRVTPRPVDAPAYDAYEFPSYGGPLPEEWSQETRDFFAEQMAMRDPLNWKSLDDYTRAATDANFTGAAVYVEAQVHGGVAITDIERVVFNGAAPSEEMIARMEAAGITWSHEPLSIGEQYAAATRDATAAAQHAEQAALTPWEQQRAEAIADTLAQGRGADTPTATDWAQAREQAIAEAQAQARAAGLTPSEWERQRAEAIAQAQGQAVVEPVAEPEAPTVEEPPAPAPEAAAATGSADADALEAQAQTLRQQADDMLRENPYTSQAFSLYRQASELQAQADAARGGVGAIIRSEREIKRGGVFKDTIDNVNRVFDREVSRDDLARLVGADEGASVDILPGTHGLASFAYEVKALDGREMSGEFYRTKAGEVILKYDTVIVPQEERSLSSGADILESLDDLRAMGVSKLMATAEGDAASMAAREGSAFSTDFRGYYTWARLGFTGKIPEGLLLSEDGQITTLRERAQARFGPGIKTVQDIMQQPGGAAWWKANGVSWQATFDFRDGSYSRSVLDPMLARLRTRKSRSE